MKAHVTPKFPHNATTNCLSELKWSVRILQGMLAWIHTRLSRWRDIAVSPTLPHITKLCKHHTHTLHANCYERAYNGLHLKSNYKISKKTLKTLWHLGIHHSYHFLLSICFRESSLQAPQYNSHILLSVSSRSHRHVTPSRMSHARQFSRKKSGT